MNAPRLSPIGRRETRLLSAAPLVEGGATARVRLAPSVSSELVLRLVLGFMLSITAVSAAIVMLAQTPSLTRYNPPPSASPDPDPGSGVPGYDSRRSDVENLKDRYNTTVPLLVAGQFRLESEVADQKALVQEMRTSMALQTDRLDLIRQLLYGVFGVMAAMVAGLAKQMYTSHANSKKLDAVQGIQESTRTGNNNG